MQLSLARTPELRTTEGRRVPLPALDAALLAWLAVEGATTRDRLALLLWPGVDDAAARNSLRQRVFKLRREHGAGLVSGRTTLSLAAGVTHDLAAATTLLDELQSEPAGEFAHWLAAQRDMRRLWHAARLVEATEAAEQAGDLGTAIARARELVGADPTSEAAHCRLMRLHYAAGDRAAALLAFDRCEAVLKDEVGASPSAETLALLALIERSGSTPTSGSAAATPTAQRRPVPAAVLRPPRLVGRDAEWHRLAEAWRERRFAAVIGEGGLGKSRLVGDFAASQGGALMSGARPGDERVVYAAVSRLLRQLPRAAVDALPAPVRSELARLLPELGEARPIASAAERARFFNAVSIALDDGDADRHGTTGAAIGSVVFDDLHFADDASIELLQYVSAGSRRPWIVTARPAEISTAGRALLDDFLAQPEAERIVLAPLGVSDLRELLASLAIDGLDADAEAPALHARTGGNPLFVLETIKLRLASAASGSHALPALVGAAADGFSGPASGGSFPSAVPTSVAALIERRIGHLSTTAVQLARCAAVAAPDFDIELAAHVLGLRTLALADPWAELEAAQVLRDDGAFAHDLIYESALASVPAPVARRLHAEVAAFLEVRGGAPARIAGHWIAAGDDARAFDALMLAATAAREALRLREHCDCLLRAVDIGERIGRLGDAFQALHAWSHAMRTVDRTQIGLPLYDRLDRLAASATDSAESMLARSIWLRDAGDFVASAAAAEAAATLARSHQLPMLEVKATLYSAGCASFLGQTERAVRLLRSALPWVIAEGPPEAQATYFNDFACCLDHANEPVEAEAFHRRALAVCHAMGSHERAALSGANLAANRRGVGAMAEALQALQQARRQALAIDAAQGVTWPIDLHTVAVLRDSARYGDALRASELLLEAMGQNPSMVVAGHANLACLWIHMGQPARAHQSLEAARGLPTIPFLHARLAQLEGRLKLALGHPAGPALLLARERVATGGRGSLALMIELDFAWLSAPAEALASTLAVLERAEKAGLAGVALAARIRAARFAARACDTAMAARLADAILAAPEGIEPDDLYRGELWLAAAEAFDGVGRTDAAGAAVAAGVAWLSAVAADQVPPEFRSGFLERNPVNRELLARRARLGVRKA
ncbi:MAG: AAA family ATPase [Caldimonas sp.]